MNRPSSPSQPRQITVAPVRKSVRVDAGAARAFDVFTAGLTRWWPRTHHIGTAPMKEGVIEPRVGGRWYERGEDGSECEWGKVLVWEPPFRVVLAWHITPQFKYDPTRFSEVEVRFIAEGAAATRVELEHRNLDRFGADEGAQMREKVAAPNGWTAIMSLYADCASKKE
jgi:activator of Hsp90 ATPase-like protein